MKPGNKALLIDIIIILVISLWLYFISVLFSSESSEVKRETDDLIEKQLQLDFDQIDEDFDDSEDDDITMIQGYGASMDSQDENNGESSDVYEETITYTDSTPVSIIDVDDNLQPVEVSDSDIDFDLSDAIDSSERVIRNYDSFISDFSDIEPANTKSVSHWFKYYDDYLDYPMLSAAMKDMWLRSTSCPHIFCQQVADDWTYRNQKHYYWDSVKWKMILIPNVYFVSDCEYYDQIYWSVKSL